MRGLILALQFLTILPIKTKAELRTNDLPRSVAFYVPVGLLQGAVMVLTDYALLAFLPVDVRTAVVLLAYIMTDAGFHLDGLADTFDAMAVKSSGNAVADREKRLAVMKGSTTGPSGVVAIIFVLGLAYLCMRHISSTAQTSTYYAILLLMPAVSKWAMGVLMYFGKPARNEGLGYIMMTGLGLTEILISTVFYGIASIALWRYAGGLLIIGPMLAIAYALYWARLSAIRFGGVTGDVCGAVGKTVEVIFLLAGAAWLQRSI